ncbi:MAG: sulfotransferase [Akkermansiaceae bacterium]|nr:sulfotransferase [Akkermansiaceae bacterium]
MPNQSPSPVFILSLPRSGSTLLQKVMATCGQIRTVPEPWVLLPLYSYDESLAMFSSFSGTGYRQAIGQLEESLPGGESDLLKAANAYGSSIYSALGEGHRYVLDKTPRYNLIARKIFQTFPRAKIIILWRNPLAVMASISRTWAKGRWTFPSYEIDLYEGLVELTKAAEENKGRFLPIQYEEFVRDPENHLLRIQDYLDLEPDSFDLNSIDGKAFQGKMGDPTGGEEYGSRVSSASVSRWHDSFGSKYRQTFGRQYLEWLGQERLSIMGYQMDDLVAELEEIKPTLGSLADFVSMKAGRLKTRFQSRIFLWSRHRRKKRLRALRLD